MHECELVADFPLWRDGLILYKRPYDIQQVSQNLDPFPNTTEGCN